MIRTYKKHKSKREQCLKLAARMWSVDALTIGGIDAMYDRHELDMGTWLDIRERIEHSMDLNDRLTVLLQRRA